MGRDVVLDVRNLKTYLYPRRGVIKAVDDVSFDLARGETLGIVGESGAGKSMLGMTLMRSVPQPVARIEGGEVWLDGQDLLTLSQEEMRLARGRDIAIILQDPQTSLNPVFTIGYQLEESIRFNTREKLDRRKRTSLATKALESVRIPDPVTRLKDYPHQMSGGMKQRVVGAMATVASPKVIIADEPTTALDVTIQAQYLALLRELRDAEGMGLIIITHDFGVVAEMCDRVMVMYGGRTVEHGSVDQIFDNPRHPYTKGLIDCMLNATPDKSRLPTIEGVPPDLASLGRGCSFEPRCVYSDEKCVEENPGRFMVSPSHAVECWRLEDPSWKP